MPGVFTDTVEQSSEVSVDGNEFQEVASEALSIGDDALVYLDKIVYSAELKVDDSNDSAEIEVFYDSETPSGAEINRSSRQNTSNGNTSYNQVSGSFAVGEYVESEALSYLLGADLRNPSSMFRTAYARNIEIIGLGRRVL